MQSQIEQQQMDDFFHFHAQTADKLDAMVAHRTGEQVESVTKVQRIDQRLDAVLMEPLLTAGTLQHLTVPFPLFATIAVTLLVVYSMLAVPRQSLQLENQGIFL